MKITGPIEDRSLAWMVSAILAYVATLMLDLTAERAVQLGAALSGAGIAIASFVPAAYRNGVRTIAMITVITLGIGGCSASITRGENVYSLGMFQLQPSDEVQSAQHTVIGAEVEPLGAEGPKVKLGMITSKITRIPGYEAGTHHPNVVMETTVDQETGQAISDSVSVNALTSDAVP